MITHLCANVAPSTRDDELQGLLRPLTRSAWKTAQRPHRFSVYGPDDRVYRIIRAESAEVEAIKEALLHLDLKFELV